MSNGSDLRSKLRVGDKKVRLADVDPGGSHGGKGAEAEAATAEQLERLTDLQDRLWAEHKHKVLVILQGIDAAGKDGTIRRVMTAFNPQGTPVASFKQPTPEELAHDFLWRIHKKVPAAGEIGIFNRSHYEDVLIVRVHEFVPRDVWMQRYDRSRVRKGACADRNDDRQVLPVHRQGRATEALPGALRQPQEALEVLAW